MNFPVIIQKDLESEEHKILLKLSDSVRYYRYYLLENILNVTSYGCSWFVVLYKCLDFIYARVLATVLLL